MTHFSFSASPNQLLLARSWMSVSLFYGFVSPHPPCSPPVWCFGMVWSIRVSILFTLVFFGVILNCYTFHIPPQPNMNLLCFQNNAYIRYETQSVVLGSYICKSDSEGVHASPPTTWGRHCMEWVLPWSAWLEFCQCIFSLIKCYLTAILVMLLLVRQEQHKLVSMSVQ